MIDIVIELSSMALYGMMVQFIWRMEKKDRWIIQNHTQFHISTFYLYRQFKPMWFECVIPLVVYHLIYIHVRRRYPMVGLLEQLKKIE